MQWGEGGISCMLNTVEVSKGRGGISSDMTVEVSSGGICSQSHTHPNTVVV